MREYLIPLLGCLCLSFPLPSASQASAPKNYRNAVDAWVKTIQHDSTLLILQAQPGRTPRKKNEPTLMLQGGWKGNELQWLQWGTGSWAKHASVTRIYFLHHQPALLVQQYYNESRMGSCGQVGVTMIHYLKDGRPVSGFLHCLTAIYSCYGYQLIRPDMYYLNRQISQYREQLQRSGVRVKSQREILLYWPLMIGGTEADSRWESYGE